MLRKIIQPLVAVAIILAPVTSMSAPNEDIHREITEGKIAAAQVIYLEAEIFASQALLDRELTKVATANISNDEGKVIAAMVNYIERSLDKLRYDLETSSLEEGTNLTKIEKEIEKLNEMIGTINR